MICRGLDIMLFGASLMPPEYRIGANREANMAPNAAAKQRRRRRRRRRQIMARKQRFQPRLITPDPVYHQVMVSRLINKVMYSGKKTVARKQVYRAFALVAKKTKKDAVEVFQQALANIIPEIEVRARRVGGAAYQVPVPVNERRRRSLALRWLVDEARKRPNSSYHTFGEKLAAEIMEAAKNEGKAVAKRQEIEKLAEANRAFAHLRW